MSSQNSNNDFRFPAEFEEQEAIWLGWPVYENVKGISSIPVILEIIRVLVNLKPGPGGAKPLRVNIAAQSEGQGQKAEIEKSIRDASIPTDRITIYTIPHDDIWFRDTGPIFLCDGSGKMVVQKFGFNGWGYEAADSPLIARDRKVPNLVAEQLHLELRDPDPTLISEGGDREFNGKGTMIAVETVERQRNPNKSREEIEAEFNKIFNLKKVIWLKKGLYEDDHVFDGPLPGPDGRKDILTCMTTGGHIDEFCRFVSADTVLLAEVSKEEAETNPIAAENRKRMQENLNILEASVDQDNKKLKIIRIPLPEPLFTTIKAGDGVYDAYIAKYRSGFVFPLGSEIKVIAACSYNNFLITNGAVLAQKYWKPGLPESIRKKDEEARKILEKLFSPNRAVHMLDVMALNLGGGGIHCITQQQPRVN